MKLVELLAKELDVWPCDGPATQDPDKEIRFDKSSHDFYVKDLAEDAGDDYGSGVEVTSAQWQAERDRQKVGEWKRHRGGKQPVADGVLVEVKLRDGDIQQHYAEGFAWPFTDCDVDANILKYRVISQPQAEEVEVKDTTIGTLSYKVEIDTTEASQAIDDLTAKWDQIETPFKWRDEVTELNAYIEKYTREREALIERLASEGFALIPPVVSVVSEFAGADMSDWRNWQEGDVIEVIANKGGHEFETGHEVTVINIDEEDATCRIEATKDGEDWWLAKSDGKFIRRP